METLADPKLGSEAPFLSQLSLRRDRGLVALVTSDCSACNQAKIARFSKMPLPSKADRVVVVTGSMDAEEAKRLSRENGARVVLSPKGLVDRWDAVFYPRVYAISSASKFLYLQPPTASYEQGVYQAGKEFAK